MSQHQLLLLLIIYSPKHFLFNKKDHASSFYIYILQHNMIQKKRRQFQSEIRKKQIQATFKEQREILVSSAILQQQLRSIQSSDQNKQIVCIIQSIYVALRHQQKQELDSLLNNLQSLLHYSQFEASYCMISNSKAIKHMITKLINNQTVIAEGKGQWQKIQQTFQQYAIINILHLFTNVIYREGREEHFYQLAQALWTIFYSPHLGIHSQNRTFLLSTLIKVISRMLQSKNKIVLRIFKEFSLSEYLSNIICLKLKLSKQNMIELSQIIITYLDGEGVRQMNQIQGIAILGTESAQYQQFLQFSLLIIQNRIQEGYVYSMDTCINVIARYPHLVNNFNKSLLLQLTQFLKLSPTPIKKKALQLICDIIYRQPQLANDLLENNYLVDALYIFITQQTMMVDESIDQYVYIVSCIICNLALNGSKKGLSLLLKHKIWDLALQNLRNGTLFCLIHMFQYHPQPKGLVDCYLFGVSLLDMQFINKRQSQCIKRTINRLYCMFTQSLDEDEPQWIENLLQRYRLKHFVQNLHPQAYISI